MTCERSGRRLIASALTSEVGAIDAPTHRLMGVTRQHQSGPRTRGSPLDSLIIHFTSTCAPIGGDIESVVADIEIFAAEVMPNF